MNRKLLNKYASLIVRVGGNVREGMPVVVYAAVEQRDLALAVVRECYRCGAKKVRFKKSAKQCPSSQ